MLVLEFLTQVEALDVIRVALSPLSLGVFDKLSQDTLLDKICSIR